MIEVVCQRQVKRELEQLLWAGLLGELIHLVVVFHRLADDQGIPMRVDVKVILTGRGNAR